MLMDTFSDDYIDYDCYDDDDCGIESCDSKFHVGPGGVFKDLAAIKWWQLLQVRKLLQVSFNESVNSEDYFTVGGGCDPQVKITSGTWGFNGSVYVCKNDIAQCRLCRVGNCISFCYVPCGEELNYDVEDQNPDPNFPDDPVFGDPVGAGIPVRFGRAIITECSEDVSPPDWLKYTFTAKGVGKIYRFNYCQGLNQYDESVAPDGATPGVAIPFVDSAGVPLQEAA